ncbi:MAG TPA: bifunctional 4-hydroxy-2-oxoglutarate aldolase/2-dehydro-3-deoxy-phosphogluconate aldolase [Caulobacteraceae bacterium]|jgi:2-dehydro-3-deoxyphosphogluconate aldolase/(4S)-4-hydroxy-2-oxoglutarate aldolase|nr:bifunctional 4-hydroxy-2-oxoglutarate aldolase/2-dehydro-3-deoxy-phosphogluconate aldolase [Caulobacteraceae bacterium]
MTLALDSLMSLAPVIPVLVIEEEADAVPLAQALAAGGIRALEVTLRTPAALGAILRIANEAPEAVVGAGTVLNGRDLEAAADVGARFIVSPGLTEGLAEAAAAARLPLLPGVATATDIMRGLDLGLSRFKFFPAESSGGPAAVAAFGGPFPGCRFCPTGGIGPEQAPRYLALRNVACVGGSWLVPRDLVRAKEWRRIEDLARAAAAFARAAD